MILMNTTPMMVQWQTCKAQAKDALLFFRLGDFYEAFYEDANLIAKQLGLTLTARQGIPMCGVPFHTAESYIDKLIAKGFKVAVAEQTEDPKAAKGLVRREITQIVTPGTIINSQLINDKKNNFFVSISQGNTKFGLAILDITTSEFRVKEFEKQQELIDELCRLSPSEILAPKSCDFLKELSQLFPFIANLKDTLDLNLSTDVLTGHFDVHNLEGFGLRSKPAMVIAAGSLLLYLKEELNLSLEHIVSIQTDANSKFMAIDRSTMRNLELMESLLNLLDETATPMGGRLLKNWLQYPLLCLSSIEERQLAVSTYIENKEVSKKARDILFKIKDLERLVMRISTRHAGPRDLFALGVSLSFVGPLSQALSIELPSTGSLSEKILSGMNESPPLRIGEGDIFKDGYREELDEQRNLSKDSMSWMARYQTDLREQTGLKTLKVGYTRAFGYYIEVSRLQSEKIPNTFHRRQTLTNAERFITEELKQFEQKVLAAEEKAKSIEADLYEQLRAEVVKESANILALAKAIANIDVLLSLALVATKYNWTKPALDNSDVLEIVEGRHPVIEKNIGSSFFIPNDTFLHSEQQLMLITGPNMAGKSTYIRQTALIVILAQIGSYVPAKSARIGLIEKVFSRIGASDDLARGQSTFMVEMSETANILNNATSRSLVLLDEIGRGTSTYDGISIAWAVAEYLLTTPHKQAKVLFATHYWELTKLQQEYPHAVNFQTAVQETPSGVVFLRKIVKGGTDKSYGIHVAKLAGLPVKAIRRAEEMLKKLEKKPDSQIPLFVATAQEHPVLVELSKTDILNLTPIQAQHKLCELVKLAKKIPADVV
jgi:DNA mismatch repair protein MutS